MHLGKTVFGQLMDFIPAYEFRRCVDRYQGNRKVSSFSCWDQFLSMAFAQLTYRENLRVIETCRRALGRRLYHLGIRGRVSRSTLRELALERPRFGYRRLGVMLRRRGWAANRKRVYRLYREEGLAVRRRKRKRVAAERVPLAMPTQPNEVWTMDFTHDTLASGRKFRTLNLMDGYTREALAIEVDTSLPGARVARVLEEVAGERGYPEGIQVDNGPEFISQVLDQWAYEHGVTLHFIRPGKPTDNGHIESFNGKFRDECLNQYWFVNLVEARERIEAWRRDYNQQRPHSSLGYQTPAEFAAQAAARGASPPTPLALPKPERQTPELIL